MFNWKLSTEPVIFLYQTVVFIYYNIIPQLLLKKICLRSQDFNQTLCTHPETIPTTVHEAASKWWLLILLCFELPGIITVFVSGPITDVIGRRKVLQCFPLIDVLASVVFILNAYFITAHPGYIMVGFFLTALFGESQGVQYISFAFVAKITSRATSERTPRIAFIEASLQASGILASLLGGYLLQWLGYVWVFSVTLTLDLILFAYVTLYLSKFVVEDGSETVHLIQKQEQQEQDGATSTYSGIDESEAESRVTVDGDTQRFAVSATGSGSSFHIYLEQIKDLMRAMRDSSALRIMIVLYMLTYFATSGEQLIQTLYLKNKPFSFSAENVGYYGAAQATSRCIGILMISQLSHRYLHLSDYILIILGTSSQLVSLILIGLSRATWLVFLSTVCSFAAPSISVGTRSMLTKHVPGEKFGAILSLLGSMAIVMGLLSNLIAVQVYEQTLMHYSGIAYFCLALFVAVALVVVVVSYVVARKSGGQEG